MATLTVQTITESGLTATYASASAGGDVVANDGNVFLHVKNASGSPITLTIAKQTSATINDTVYGKLTKADATATIAAGAEVLIGGFKPDAFNNSSGQIAISYSSATSVTIAALKRN